MLIVMVSAALLLMAATPALAQSPVSGVGDVISPASQDQYGDPPVEEAARDAPGYAVAHAFTASEAFEEARAAAKSAGADDEAASALAAQAVAPRDEVGSESKSAGTASIQRLPETGGAGLLFLGVAVLSFACGFVARGVIR